MEIMFLPGIHDQSIYKHQLVTSENSHNAFEDIW